VSHWDRPVPKDKISQKLPDQLNEERSAALLLCIRAYHSLVRTLGEAHVDEIIPPDVKAAASRVIAGTDDITEFLTDWTLTHDKTGITSSKYIPVSVVKREWMMFINQKYGKKKTSVMNKKDWQAFLRCTGAVPLLRFDADKNRGPHTTFNIKKYKNAWPPLDCIEYQISDVRTLKFSKPKEYAWLVGVALKLGECPRIRSDDGGDGSGYCGDASGGGVVASSSVSDEQLTRIGKFENGEDILSSTEKTAVTVFTHMRKTSASYLSIRGPAGVRVNVLPSYLKDFNIIENGNDIPSDDEYDSDDEEVLRTGELTRWEMSVLRRYWKVFGSVATGEPGVDGVDGYVCHVLPGVNRGAARKYFYHDFKTVKMRALQRGVSASLQNQLIDRYNFAIKIFND
jgi:hypothetical protein